MKLEQAARSALEALREYRDTQMIQAPRKAITALREALAEQAEPINKFDSIISWANSCPIKQPIKAEQATVSGGVCGGCAKKAADGWALYCVECWEKAEQEPVAWLWVNERGSERLEWEPVEDDSKWKSKPLYAAPLAQQDTHATHVVRTKNLTDDEIGMLCWKGASMALGDFARAVIAADRELNK